MTMNASAVIIGGGVMGASVLYNLAARGVRSPILLERDTLGAGSTGRSSGAVRMHYSTEVNARLAWESLRVFQNWADEIGGYGDPAFVRTGYMVFAPEREADGFRRNIAMQRRVGIDTRIVSWMEARELAPAFRLDESESFAWEDQSGHADPSGTALAFVSRARELGAKVALETPATGIAVSAGRVTAVETENETYATDTAVIATGPWTSRFLRHLGVDIPLIPTRHEVVLIRRSETGVGHHPGGGDMANLIYFRPEADNLTLVGNGNREEEADPDAYNQRADMDFVADVWGRLANRIPGIEDGQLAHGYAGLYTTTPDLHPVIDRVDGIDGLYICSGFSGHGFKLAPAVGTCVAQLILDGESSLVDITPLRMSRFSDGSLNSTEYDFKVIA